MDPFATLGIAQRFDVDLAALEKTHRELSRTLHPDKFVSAGASERRSALSKAVLVNEAWRVVRDPIRRAEALFALAGVAVGERNEPRSEPAFLMEMMEQREALAEARAARDMAKMKALEGAVRERAAETEAALKLAFDAANGDKAKLETYLSKLGELRFYRRFLEEVSAIESEEDEKG